MTLLHLNSSSDSSRIWEIWQAGFVRIGLVLFTLWLALPVMQRNSSVARVLGGTLVGAMLLVAALTRVPLRWVIPAGVLVGAAALVLRPRAKPSPEDRRPR